MISLMIKDLDPVVLLVADDNAVVEVEGDSYRTLELTIQRAPRPKGPEEVAKGVKDQDPVIAVVTDDDVVEEISGHSLRTVHLSGS